MNYYTSHFLNPHGSCKPCQRRLRSYKGHNALSLRGIPVGQGPLRPFLSCIVSLTHIDSKEPQRQKHLFGGGTYVASRTPHVRFPADRRGRHKPVEAFRAGPSDGTPVHPRAVNVLYLMYLCSCLVERTWRFALPLVLAHLEGARWPFGNFYLNVQDTLLTYPGCNRHVRRRIPSHCSLGLCISFGMVAAGPCCRSVTGQTVPSLWAWGYDCLAKLRSNSFRFGSPHNSKESSTCNHRGSALCIASLVFDVGTVDGNSIGVGY